QVQRPAQPDAAAQQQADAQRQPLAGRLGVRAGVDDRADQDGAGQQEQGRQAVHLPRAEGQRPGGQGRRPVVEQDVQVGDVSQQRLTGGQHTHIAGTLTMQTGRTGAASLSHGTHGTYATYGTEGDRVERYFATCGRGVEPALAGELRALGASDVEPG